VAWITAPAGAGKTVLAAGWLAARRLRHLWYEVDASDGDPATLFHHTGLAARDLAPRRPPLPPLTPAHAAAFQAFARRHFEELFARLGSPAALIVDNLHLAPQDAPIHLALAEAVAALPAGVHLLVLSQSEPPPPFAPLCVKDLVAEIGADELLLTRGEALAIARRRAGGKVPPAEARRLWERAGGWTAGFAVLLDAAAGGGARGGGAAGERVLFDLFAREVLDRTEASARRILLACALLPEIDATLAARLTCDPGAPRVLAALQRRGAFTLGHADGNAWRFHPLFRTFLLERAAAELPPEQLDRLRRQAAVLFEAKGRLDAAADLLREGAAWDALAGLVLRRAPELAAQGRTLTLLSWLRAMPAGAVSASPWLQFWQATGLALQAPAEARERFAAAFETFRAAGDGPGMLASWAEGATLGFFTLSTPADLKAWLERFDVHLAGRPIPSEALEARVLAARFLLLMFLRPTAPDVTATGRRAVELARRLGDAGAELQAGCFLVVFQLWLGAFGDAELTLEGLRRLAAAPEVAPLLRTTFGTTEALAAFHLGDLERCCEVVEATVAAGADSGVRHWDPHVLGHGAAAALSLGDLPRAASYLRRIEPYLPFTSPHDVVYYELLDMWHAVASGDARRAATRLASIERSGLVELTPYHVALGACGRALVAELEGDLAAAAADAARAGDAARALGSASLEYQAEVLRASIAHSRGRAEEARAALARGFALGRAGRYVNHYGWRSGAMSRLCALALAEGIEPDHAREVVRRRRLPPPRDLPGTGEGWPWPVEARTLGRFELRVDGAPLAFEGRTQRRPLELAMALAALGPRGATTAELCDALWPDAEADQAHQALTVALHRLRRLLRHEDALRLADGRLSFDPELVWVDAEAFERTTRGDAAGRLAGVALYHGPFLRGVAAGWAVAPRERLHARFLRSIEEEAAAPRGRDDETIRLLERGLETDPVAEPLYRALIRCHVRSGRLAEAAAAYRRCERILAAHLRVAPSPETRALAGPALAGSTPRS
jgi:ATP/maltotriose-dependent transcriptional regulator MalT/DNA-binding SARP family transcriptional activator